MAYKDDLLILAISVMIVRYRVWNTLSVTMVREQWGESVVFYMSQCQLLMHALMRFADDFFGGGLCASTFRYPYPS